MEREERGVMWRLNPRRGWDGEGRERCDVEIEPKEGVGWRGKREM